MRHSVAFITVLVAAFACTSAKAAEPLRLTEAEYLDRIHAIWAAQMIAVVAAIPFEHKVAAVRPLQEQPLMWKGRVVEVAPVDDDWYYEMSAVRAFEKYGPGLNVAQLGEQWKQDECGSWGSSLEARLNLQKGLVPPATGHPRYNKLWFSIGPQFSADLYGALTPGLPNAAGKLAREFGHLNGYAEGADGAVFMATAVSLAFVRQDPQVVVREAAQILHPDSPYRRCLDLVIGLAEAGRSFAEVVNAVEDRWHMEYPATNNAVANGGIVAAGLWFGRGDFWTTVNLISGAADFTDSDCNAANAAAILGAMHGMRGLPAAHVAQLGDRIRGTGMGAVKVFKTPVDESISGLARRTAVIGGQMLTREGIAFVDGAWRIPKQPVVTQPAELFSLGDLMRYWNPAWTLERAGFGGAGGGMRGIRGNTHLDGDVLATYPRDEVRGCLLRCSATLSVDSRLSVEVCAEQNRAWQLEIYADDDLLEQQTIIGAAAERQWRAIEVKLEKLAGRNVTLRLYQRVLLPNHIAGNALWRNLQLR